MIEAHYAWQLLGEDNLPEGFDRSLTVHGLISNGRNRFPGEWSAVLADRFATGQVFRYIADGSNPSDLKRFDLIDRMVRAVADR